MALTALQEHLRDERIWCIAAIVALHKGESQHYHFEKNGQMSISVRTLRHDVSIHAFLKGGGTGIGTWFIPPIGTEVIVEFDDGNFEGDAYITGIHGNAPTNLEPGKVFVLGDHVEIRSPDGTAKKLAFQEDLNTLENAYNGHTHTVSTTGSPTAHTGTTAPTTASVTNSSGTDVVKGE